MDYRCPACGTNLGKRRWGETIVARMEIECPHCKNVIRLNVHRAEEILAPMVLGTIILLSILGYWLQSRALMIAAFGAALAGALAFPVLERIILRSWRRYASNDRRPKS